MALSAVGILSSAHAADLVTAQPHQFVIGPSRGYATARGVDPTRARRAALLPAADGARVSWKRQIPGGVSGNVLVDGDGRIFLAGPGRVTQLGSDGALQYSQLEGSSAPVAAALLGDGTRAVLSRDGRVVGWWPSGGLAFDVGLEVPAATSTSSLLPLPDGGALASVGEWLFELDATRVVRSHAAAPAPIQHAMVAGARAIVIDERGRVFEWDRRSPLRSVAAFGAPVAAGALDGDTLIALGVRRGLSSMSLADGSVRELARLDAPGVAPLLGGLASQRWVLMRYDGSWFISEPSGAPPALGSRAEPGALSDLDLLVDSNGAVAWWASEAPLHLETAAGVGRELPDVRCTVPVSLVPAGRGRLVAVCGSGLVWLVGPETITAEERPRGAAEGDVAPNSRALAHWHMRTERLIFERPFETGTDP